jgi:hypothetical protein
VKINNKLINILDEAILKQKHFISLYANDPESKEKFKQQEIGVLAGLQKARLIIKHELKNTLE